MAVNCVHEQIIPFSTYMYVRTRNYIMIIESRVIIVLVIIVITCIIIYVNNCKKIIQEIRSSHLIA